MPAATIRLLVAVVATLVLAPVAHANMSVAVEDENGRDRVDHFEVYDVICDHEANSLTLGGRSSGTIDVCGGLDQPGDVRIRFQGDSAWTDYPELHSWSVIQLPARPPSLQRRKPIGDDDK